MGDEFVASKQTKGRRMWVMVPAEKIDALREAVETLEQSDIFTSKQIVDAVAVFRAVVDAVETEDETNEDKLRRLIGHLPAHAPSPARDDAETAITDELRKHHLFGEDSDGTVVCYCSGRFPNRQDHRAHIASVIAAHMAAPDELTALREGLNLILDGAAGVYGSENVPRSIGDVLTEIHNLLGDA